EGGQALNLAGTQYPNVAVQAKYTIGLALARSGAPRAGRDLCKQAVNVATNTNDPRLISSAALSYAETLLANGEAAHAVEAALGAQTSFAAFGQQDSEWRAWLIAACGKQQLGEVAAAREYASQARDRLSNLAQKWGDETYNNYVARRDIQSLVNLL